MLLVTALPTSTSFYFVLKSRKLFYNQLYRQKKYSPSPWLLKYSKKYIANETILGLKERSNII